jgi:uncharacterized protein YjbI with pentapeptide repeats
MTGARLEHAFLRNGDVTSATFEGADLTSAKLAACDCSRAGFLDAVLEKTLTMGSRFKRADFTGATRFFLSREIIAEVLRSEIGADFELQQLVGAIMRAPDWCYRQWRT